MLSLRQSKILFSLIKEYISTAEPVGSELLVGKYNFKVSSATVRNEMLELDKQGFLAQPHTSAGRIPTQVAYQHYLTQNFKPKSLTQLQKDKFDIGVKRGKIRSQREHFKRIAQILAELSQQFILAALAENDFYYTGLTNLFSQAEFRDHHFICNVSAVIDHLDRRLTKLFHKADNQVQILVGSQNPIDETLSLLLLKFKPGPLLGILGPMRMDYAQNVGLLEYSKKLLNS